MLRALTILTCSTTAALLTSIAVIFANSLAAMGEDRAVTDGQATSPQPSRAELEKIKFFTAFEHEQNGRIYHYRVFVPKNSHLRDRCPVLVWLHGYGESGNDNWRHLAYIQDEVVRWEKDGSGFPCLVLAVQSPFKDHWGTEMMSIVRKLIRRTTTSWHGDEDRIYVAGVSTGGNATWEIILRYPDIFAAAVPMASNGLGHRSVDLSLICHLPIWAFHTENDSTLPSYGARQIIGELANAGGQCILTESSGTSHDCWTSAFRSYHVITWLLKQRRHNDPKSAIAEAKWSAFVVEKLQPKHFLSYFILIGMIGLTAWTLCHEIRRQKKKDCLHSRSDSHSQNGRSPKTCD